MKKIILVLSLVSCLQPLSAQKTWHKKLPFTVAPPVFASLSVAQGGFQVSNQNQFVLIREDGSTAGAVKTLPSFLNWVSIQQEQPNSAPYFLLARRNGPATKYYLAYYQSGVGVVNEQEFPDSLSSLSQKASPVFVSLGNHALMAFGGKYIRKISYTSQGNFTEDWVKNATFSANGAILAGAQVIVCGTGGTLKSFDVDGNLLWEKFYPFEPQTVKACPGGYVLTGKSNTQEPVLFKVDGNGELLWSAPMPGKSVSDGCPTNDGGFALTGQTPANETMLLKTDGSGNVLWSKTLGYTKGLSITGNADGGVTFLAIGASSSLYLIKTNALGEASLVPEDVYTGERHLSNGGFSLTQSPSSNLFFNGLESTLHIPADSSTSTLFSHSLWIAGKDNGGNIHICAGDYGEFTGSDYQMGIGSASNQDFNRVWSVSREEIAEMRRDFEEDGHLDAAPPHDLLDWPAKGNPNFHQNLDFSFVSTSPDSFPAPFVDANGNGKYNVYEGDYPLLKGDRMLWLVFNDQKVHQLTNGQPVSVDVLLTVYAYDCPQNGYVQQTIFADYQIINRSSENYSDTYIGFFTDPDLGCPDDDYLGCLPDVNSTYVYNQDAIDGQPGSSCAGGVSTYNNKVPVQSITQLNQSLDQFIYFNRGGSFGGPGQSDPAAPNEFYNYLQAIWRDGTPLTIGGHGYDPGNPAAVPTRYAFPDNPADPQGWSMCSANLALGDRRIVSSHGPFPFAAGDTFNMRFAFIYHPDIPHPCPDINTWVKPTVVQIRQWAADGTLDAPLDLGSVQILQPGQSITLDAGLPNAGPYVWSTGAQTPSITVNQPGEYTVSVTRASGCASTESVLVKYASGLLEPTAPDWQLMPNPAGEWLEIRLENNASLTNALIYNAQGQLMQTTSFNGTSTRMSVATLPSGLYWVEVWQEGRFAGGRKVVVE